VDRAPALGLLPPTDTPIRSRARQRGLDLQRLPVHVGIIMDGNGRWAERRGLPRLLGHRQGYKNLRGVLLDAADLGIGVLTVYAFSAENWRRPQPEVSGLLSLIERAARDELRVLHKNNVRVIASGRLSEVPASLREALDTGAETTARNTRMVFNLAINYGGRAEIVDAVRRIGKEVADGTLAPDSIDETTVGERLYHPEIPDPDLIIRTAGQDRISNFLLWQAAYAEIHTTPTLWPEFGEEDLLRAVADYQERTRKFGGLANGKP
jgi:undecaprenyl diphosphate synthase